jgi:hypothetical protein
MVEQALITTATKTTGKYLTIIISIVDSDQPGTDQNRDYNL